MSAPIVLRPSTYRRPPEAGTRLVRFDRLATDEIDAWQRLRASNPALHSPFFHPAFAAAVHASGTPVHVAVTRSERGEVTALLAGHRQGSRLLPVGSPGADFQAPIAAPGQPAAPLSLLPGSIREASFDHLLSPGVHFDPFVISRRASPWIDTRGGLDGYLGRASRTGRDSMAQARRRLAKAEREIGPVRFAADVIDDDVLAELILLKRGRYAATGAGDYFADAERIDLLSILMRTREADFGGMLSTLHIGGNLVAAHFGIRAGSVLHWWFPVYDPAYAHLAPGWLLLRELVAAAPELDVERIDLGRGDDEYKRRAKTGETVVCRATLTRSTTLLAARRTAYHAVETVRPWLRSVISRIRDARRGRPEKGNA